MRNLLILFIIYYLSTEECLCQKQEIDSLQKYSYSLFGLVYSTNTVEIATAFFIKNNNRLYLVTASHVFTSWNPMQYIQETAYPDTFYLRLFRKDDNSPALVSINIIPFKNSFDKFYFYEKPDIIFYEIKDKQIEDKCKIYTINNFITVEKISEIPIRTINYGFSPDIPPHTNIDTFGTIQSSLAIGKVIGDLNYKINWSEYPVISDSINFRIKTISGKAGRGFSGSPVFFQYSNSQSLIFGGICIAGDSSSSNLHELLNVRKECILNSIHQLTDIK